jgi:hypothetical protein
MKISHIIISCAIGLLAFSGAQAQVKNASFSGKKYHSYRDSIYAEERKNSYDSTNIFDDEAFIPGKNSFDTFLLKMEKFMLEDDQQKSHNQAALAGFRAAVNSTTDPGTCRELNCLLYAEIVKSEQLMYLYLNGEPWTLSRCPPAETDMKPQILICVHPDRCSLNIHLKNSRVVITRDWETCPMPFS